MRISTAGNNTIPGKQLGYTYLAALAAIVTLSISLSTAVLLNQRKAKAELEAELLFRGSAYIQAIRHYYEAQSGAQRYPSTLEDLIKDPRYVERRHLRQLYPDPLIKDGEWRLIPAIDGGIKGIASTSKKTPLREKGFPKGLATFENSASYSDWEFIYSPKKNNSKAISNE